MNGKDKFLPYGWLCVICLMLASIAGCKKSTQAAKPQTPDVEVVEVAQKDIPIYGQWIGTLDGFVNANVKAQVTGYLLRQDYKEGSFVKKGSCSSRWIRTPVRSGSPRCFPILEICYAPLTSKPSRVPLGMFQML